MDNQRAADFLEALGNPTRLAIYRLLVQAGHGGSPVGELQRHLGVPASTLSHHLARLTRQGLVTQERQGRTLICRTVYDRMDELVAYLQNNCCGGLQAPSTAAPSSACRTE